MNEKRKHWEERKNKDGAEKAKKMIPGQALIQTEADEDSQGDHQDEDDDLNFAFMQNKVEDTPILKEQRARETLKPSYIYLDSTSSFHQMFRAKYMTDIHQVNIALRGKCNGGESHSDEKGCVLDMFCMWLVCSGIANLLSLPTLERDGYVCSYKTNSPWIMECPDVLRQTRFIPGVNVGSKYSMEFYS